VPPIKLEQKVALYRANKLAVPSLGKCFCMTNFRLFTSGFHFFSLCALPRTNLFDFQLKPLRGICSCYKITNEFKDDLIDNRVCKGVTCYAQATHKHIYSIFTALRAPSFLTIIPIYTHIYPHSPFRP
jgi:hypothetical protein